MLKLKSQIKVENGKYSHGYTLVELIVVFAIIGLIASLGVASFASYSNNQMLRSAALDMSNVLNVAKSRSLSQVKPPDCIGKALGGYQVSINIVTNQYFLEVVCGGSIYTLDIKSLPSNISFVTGSTTPVFFAAFSGAVLSPASLALSANGQNKTILVGIVGNISMQDGANLLPTPLPEPTEDPTLEPTLSIAATSMPTVTSVPPTAAPTAIPSTDVIWTSLVNTTANGNILVNTGGTGGWDAGAISSQTIQSGNGYAEITINDTTTQDRMFGLNHDNLRADYTDIDYGLEFNPSAYAVIFENGVYRGSSRYALGDTFRIAVESGVVKYYKNGTVFYTSTQTSVYPLFVDVSLADLNAMIPNAKIVVF